MLVDMPLPVQDLVAVSAIAFFCVMLVLSGIQDLKGKAISSAVIEWLFGGFVLGFVIYNSPEQPIRQYGTVFLGILYLFAIGIICHRFFKQNL